MSSLKALLNRNREAAIARQEAMLKETVESIPEMPVNQIENADVSFSARMAAAREDARIREDEEKRAEIMARHELAKLNRLAEDELTRMIDEGGPVHYEPGTELVLSESHELEAIYDDDDDSSYLDYSQESYAESNEYVFDDIMAGVRVKPDPSQENAVRILSQVQYGCLIGAAGTGKTTTLRLLLNTLINGDPVYGIEPLRLSPVNIRAYHASTMEEGVEGEAAKEIIPSVAFCAYTGQASQVVKKNMPGNWQKNVFTIHSLLGFFPETYFDAFENKDKMRFVPYYTKQNKMPWDVIFIDESSMVAIDLWHMLLDAMKPGCRVYMIGDLNQLPPPIGMGILGFALTKWTVCELTHVHRQSNDSENMIIDTAHRVLRGEDLIPHFQDPMTDKNWRVIGLRLDHDTAKAYQQIVSLCGQLSKKLTPDGEKIYDPWRDRVMTCMNGFDENTTASLVGQAPINDALSQLFADPTQPRIVISCGMGVKKFAVGYRVMATKNESPAELNRITNGLTGRIEEIRPNPKWVGDHRLVGNEEDVKVNRRAMVEAAMSHGDERATQIAQEAGKFAGALDSMDWNDTAQADSKERNGGPSSHIVTVKFDNGAIRSYSMNAQVEQLQIAYASTTHKAQGAEMPTAIIVVHHAHRSMLCRENLYTAVTRASKRVIILYSEFGLRIALGKQKITGKTIPEKLKAYERMLGEGDGAGSLGFKLVNVRLTEKDR